MGTPTGTSTGALLRVLQVEDNQGDYVLIREMLAGSNPNATEREFELVRVETFASALQRITEESFDCVLLDLSLSDAYGVETFYTFRAFAPDVPVIIVSGLDDERAALNSVQSGAQDYLLKGELTEYLLRRTIRYAVERARITRAFNVVRDEAVWASKTKSEFIVDVGVELKRQLASLRSEVEQFLEHAPKSVERELLSRVNEALITSESTVSHAVDYGRIDLGEMLLVEDIFAVRHLLLRLKRHLEFRFQDVPVHATCADDIPEYLFGDSGRVEQVILFLAHFLERHCRRGGDLSLHVARRDGGQIEVTLARANGQLTADKQQSVFESFAQANVSVLRKFGSDGLGLAVCARIVSLLRGKIWLVSNPGSPTAFHFTGTFREVDRSKVKLLSEG